MASDLRPTMWAIARFLVGGGINTALTFALYWLLLLAVDYRLAYAISFVTGIGISYVLNTKYVFRTHFSLRRIIFFPLVYVATYLAGAAVLQLAVARYGVDVKLAPFISICVTLPLTYFLSKLVLTGVLGGGNQH